MSPLKRKKLRKIRLELDKLDNSLIKIIKKRTNLVKQVLELKDKKNQIIDQRRIKSILKNIRKKSLAGLYFFAFSFTLAFSPPAGFLT